MSAPDRHEAVETPWEWPTVPSQAQQKLNSGAQSKQCSQGILSTSFLHLMHVEWEHAARVYGRGDAELYHHSLDMPSKLQMPHISEDQISSV